MNELFLSIDIETDGPCPGLNSMLSLGAVVVDPSLPDATCLLAGFEANLKTLPGAIPNDDTMKWWHSQPPEAWNAHRHNMVDPYTAMAQFGGWIKSIEEKNPGANLVPLAWPAAFDWCFLNYYCWHFLQRNPLGYQCADARSYFAGAAGTDWLANADANSLMRTFLNTIKPAPTDAWDFPVTRAIGTPAGLDGTTANHYSRYYQPGRSHVALDDAAEQAVHFARAVRIRKNAGAQCEEAAAMGWKQLHHLAM